MYVARDMTPSSNAGEDDYWNYNNLSFQAGVSTVTVVSKTGLHLDRIEFYPANDRGGPRICKVEAVGAVTTLSYTGELGEIKSLFVNYSSRGTFIVDVYYRGEVYQWVSI